MTAPDPTAGPPDPAPCPARTAHATPAARPPGHPCPGPPGPRDSDAPPSRAALVARPDARAPDLFATTPSAVRSHCLSLHAPTGRCRSSIRTTLRWWWCQTRPHCGRWHPPRGVSEHSISRAHNPPARSRPAGRCNSAAGVSAPLAGSAPGAADAADVKRSKARGETSRSGAGRGGAGNSLPSALSTAWSGQVSVGRELVRRSTATSWRSGRADAVHGSACTGAPALMSWGRARRCSNHTCPTASSRSSRGRRHRSPRRAGRRRTPASTPTVAGSASDAASRWSGMVTGEHGWRHARQPMSHPEAARLDAMRGVTVRPSGSHGE